VDTCVAEGWRIADTERSIKGQHSVLKPSAPISQTLNPSTWNPCTPADLQPGQTYYYSVKGAATSREFNFTVRFVGVGGWCGGLHAGSHSAKPRFLRGLSISASFAITCTSQQQPPYLPCFLALHRCRKAISPSSWVSLQVCWWWMRDDYSWSSVN